MRQEILIIIVSMGLVTLLTRASGFLLYKKSGAAYEQWLKHIPTAMLAALIIPSLFMPRDVLFISIKNPYLLAGAVAVLVALKTNSILATVGISMTCMIMLKGFGA